MGILLSIGGYYSIVLVYIVFHRIIKGQLFQSSRYEIHRVGSQDMRKFNINRSSIIMVFSMIMLSAMIRMVMMRSKEVVVLGVMRLLIVLLVIVSIIYTLVYLNKSSVMNKVREVEGNYVLLLILMSMM